MAGETGQRHLALLIEIPDYYIADINEYRDSRSEFNSESDFILNFIGEPGIARVRMEVAGEKDSDVVEVWGSIREALLVEPSKESGDDLSRLGGAKLMRDEHSCEWCEYREGSQ